RRVVPPATGLAGPGHRVDLLDSRAGALVHDDLALPELAERIADEPPGVRDRRVHRRARKRVADSDVAGPVHRHRAHPAMAGIRRIGPLLVDAPRGGAALPELVPAHAGVTLRIVHVDRVVDRERL